MISSFKFLSYKIDRVDFRVIPNLAILRLNGAIDPSLWDLQLEIRVPQFFEGEHLYIGGMDCTLLLYPPGTPEDAKLEDSALIRLRVGIAGCFASAGRFEPKVEENLVRIQIPALLLPYLRGAATTLLANAGFGSVILPLINVHEYAQKYLQDQQVTVVPADQTPRKPES